MSGPGRDFKDHFSGHAGQYAEFRPTYPAALFDWLAEQSPDRALAWDCACGNGQATLALAERFRQVIASDASPEQIDRAVPQPNISYRVEKSERTSCESSSVSLITVAQAYHWFDHQAFHQEAGRVLKEHGLLAVWTYPLTKIDDEVDALVYELYEHWLGPYWPPERQFIDRGYRDFELPWPEIEAPAFEMTATWTMESLLGYLGTWSGLRRYMAQKGRNPLDEMRKRLEDAWGDPQESKLARWPLILRISPKASSGY